MTQLELSRRTGIRMGTINAYYHEYIKRVNIEDLNTICNVLGCRLDELMEHIPNENEEE